MATQVANRHSGRVSAGVQRHAGAQQRNPLRRDTMQARIRAGAVHGLASMLLAVSNPMAAQGFADLRPTDWAYQALIQLQDQHGCVAGYPSGGFGGGSSLSRYEAAALLQACLERVSAVTDEVRRLQREFAEELAVLKGRVDGLEAQVGALEATRFSTTTKLSGRATFVVGRQCLQRQQRTGTEACQGGGWCHHVQLRRSPQFRYQLHWSGPVAYAAAVPAISLLPPSATLRD